MSEKPTIYNFEERTFQFSKRIIALVEALDRHEINRVLISQCVRSGTSVGANYREANDALGDKDFLHRLKIARKESKETTYWLQLIQVYNRSIGNRMHNIIDESEQLTKILSSMIQKRERIHKKKGK